MSTPPVARLLVISRSRSRPLATVAGRPMLAGLKLVLDRFRLFSDADERRLPALLKKSREAQAAVSTKLAGQVLGALHDLLRGLHAADPDLTRELARSRPDHLYEGLLTVLMRLVFVLYAEDRDLIPSRSDGAARSLYDNGYSVRGLFGRLYEDAALNPDTMEERYGGWGRLLALFRLVHVGHASGFVNARGGKLFDPDAFPFLEGRSAETETPRVPKLSDGCLLRILEGLMTVRDPKTKVRQRLSYRTLDVEQIGSVYETVMGFTVEIAKGQVLAIRAGKNNRTPVFADLDELATLKPKDRQKYLRDECKRTGTLGKTVDKPLQEATAPDAIAAALDPIVDERGSPAKRPAGAGTPILQPTEERRRTGSHYTPRSLTAPIVRHALEPAFERLGPDATGRGSARSQGLRSGDGVWRVSRRGLPRHRHAPGQGMGSVAGVAAQRSRRMRTRNCTRAASLPSGASMGWTGTHERSISRGSRSGSPRWQRTTSSRSSTMRSNAVTALSA